MAVAALGDRLLVTERTGEGVVLDTAGHVVREWQSPFVAAVYASGGGTIVAARSQVLLRVWSVGISLIIEVEDDGDAVLEPAVERDLDDSTVERGRGLLIAQRLADELSIVSDEHHTLVHFERRIATPATIPTSPLR